MPNLFDSDTNTQGVIVYGGESSDDYGMVVAEAPAYERPKRKQTIYNVPGRNGSILFQQDAWEDVNRSYKVWLAEDSTDTLVEKVDAFEAWLNTQKGYVRLEDNFEPDVFRLAYYSGGDGFSNNLTQYGEATINFTCRPERFLKSGDTAVEVADGSVLTNPTRYTSKPLIYIEATASSGYLPDVSIYINGTRIRVGGFHDSVYIDCATMYAYGNPNNHSYSVTGSFPTMVPGDNTIGTSKSDYTTLTKVEITPRYFII
jgi:phage-related protein